MTITDLITKTDISPLLSAGKFVLIVYGIGQILVVVIGVGLCVWLLRKDRP